MGRINSHLITGTVVAEGQHRVKLRRTFIIEGVKELNNGAITRRRVFEIGRNPSSVIGLVIYMVSSRDDNTKVSTSTTDGPKQVGVFGARDSDCVASSGHKANRHERVKQ